MTHFATVTEQTAARGREDNGSESAADWIAAINTAFDIDIAGGNFDFRFRFLISETGGGGFNNFGEEIQFRINGGTWTDVGAATSVRWRASANFVDGDDTTEQMSGSRTFNTVNSAMTENDFTGDSGEPDLASGAGGSEFECEFMIGVIAADFSVSDTINLRIREGAVDLDNYVGASLFDMTIINTAGGARRFMSN